MKFNIQQYLEISTIHGLVYISKRFHLVEKIFWIIALIISVICTSILIIELIIKIRVVPIVVYVADDSISISEIHFPAVTVCPQIGTHLVRIQNFYRSIYYRYDKHTVQKYLLEPEEFFADTSDEIRLGNLTYLQFLDKLKFGKMRPNKMGLKLLKRLHVIDILTKSDIFYNLNYSVPTNDFLEVLNEFSKEFDIADYSFKFNWIDQKEPYFSEVITPYGLCFSFNLAFSHDLFDFNATSNDFHYRHINIKLYTDPSKRSLPHQSLELDMPRKTSNVKAGLDLQIFSMLSDQVRFVKNEFNGYMCFFHDGLELPTKNTKYQVLGLNRNIHVLVHPQLNDVDESIAEYEISDRNCYLKDEKVLKFFKIYSKNNCEAECLSDFMLVRCGCVEFFMIRSPETRICSANEKNCYEQAHVDFLLQKDTCKCFQPCRNIKYDFEITAYEFARNRNPDVSSQVDANIRFKSQYFMEFVSKQQFNTLDFMSFVGGILGLFAGFSALSFIELIYWFTVRVFVGSFKKLNIKVHPVDENEQNEGILRKLWKFFKNFFEESSVHGLKFIFGFTKIESIIWGFFLIGTLTLCFDLISDAREKVPDSRVVAYDDSLAFKGKIPFPAFTIVPQYLQRRSFYTFVWAIMHTRRDIEKYRNNKAGFEFYMKKATRQLFCKNIYDSSYYRLEDSTLPYLIGVLKEDSMVDWFREQYTSFNGKYQPKFAEIRTTRGTGFTFGLIEAEEMIDFRQVSSVFNYTSNITTEPKNLENISENFKNPLKFSRQSQPILTLRLNDATSETHEACIKASFLVHQPDYLPTFTLREEFFSFEYGSTINIEISPEVTKTDSNLKSLDPEIRGCYFEDEKRLKYFKKYSKENCQIECLTELTYNHSKCLDIDQPFKNESQICEILEKYVYNYLPYVIVSELYAAGNFTFEQNCSCLPLCNSVIYNIKYNVEFETEEKAGENVTIINVMMNMDDIVLFRRFQQFTFSDVISYVGGLLGLFAGISVLSIVEFFYFFTIRVAVDIGRMMKRRGGWV